MNTIPSFDRFTDSRLIEAMPRLIAAECGATAIVVAALAEFDARRLWLPLGYSSLFNYCVQHLRLTEDAACSRIEAARAGRKFPRVLEYLQSGELSLTAARMLAPHLTPTNHGPVLEQARHKTKREIELLVAKINPQPPVPSVVRKLPDPNPASRPNDAREGCARVEAEPRVSLSAPVAAPVSAPTPPPSRRPVVVPLSEAQYKLQVTISAAARERLQQIQGLMRHRLPNGDPAAIVEHALEVLHAALLKQKAAHVAKPRTGKLATDAKGRYIPASVKREVWRRDQGRCAFVADDGRTCGSADGVEFHHVQPYATGGDATAKNIEMRCRAHNGFEWERHLDQETLALAAPA
ncbi:MAG TPA: hypothetical protein VFZ36_09190 [Vicinamibacterales bacterium]